MRRGHITPSMNTSTPSRYGRSTHANEVASFVRMDAIDDFDATDVKRIDLVDRIDRSFGCAIERATAGFGAT